MNRYRIYWNVRLRMFSIQQKVDGRWKVVGHSHDVICDIANFVVNLRGQARVRRERVKNVHAYVETDHITLPEWQHFDESIGLDGDVVRYNPYRDDWFHIDGAATVYANVVRCRAVDGKPELRATDPVSFPLVDVTVVAA